MTQIILNNTTPAPVVAAPVAAPEQAKPVLTRKERLTNQVSNLTAQVEKFSAKLDEAKQELESLTLLENVGLGSELVVKVGRGETAKQVQATVLGVKEDDEGVKKYRVQYGEGFDAELAVVTAGSIVRVVGADTAEPEQVAGGVYIA